MSAVSVNERRDKQIQEAFDTRNWKQALQLCDKRIKKGEKSDYLLAWKAYILLSCPDMGRKKQGASETRALCERTPPITDLSALSMLEKCLRDMEAEDQLVAKLWMTAARARPQDAELQESWMMATFDAGEWKQAQSAAMILQKNFPKKRHFYFWAILANHLASISPKASETDRKIFGPLAYKMISKAASEVPSNPSELLSPPRAIQTTDELLLLLTIYRHHGHVKEALEVLDSPNLGISSTIGKGNWELVTEKLDFLEEAGMWQEQFDYCLQLLNKTRPGTNNATKQADDRTLASQGDDWRLWTGLLDASQRLGTPANMQATEDIIRSYLDQEHSSRNSNLALLKFLAQNIDNNPAMSGQLFSACKRYFEDNATRYICFDDLRPYVDHLNNADKEALMIHFASHAKGLRPRAGASEAVGVSWLASEINSLKMDYLLKVSKSRSKGRLEAFVSNCIRLYKVSLIVGNDRVYSDNKPGDDACILAVMGLVLLSEIVDKQYLIRTTPLLELLLERSKHNYQALLILVRVYIMLGAGSLAMKTYRRLAIKHLQHETLSHVLFTRLATIHPHPAHIENSSSLEKKDRDPVNGLGVALESYRSCAKQSAHGKRTFLERGRYTMLLGALEVENTMARSFCKVMWVLERRRMKRLVRYNDDEEYFDLLVPFPEEIEDRREYEVFPDYEPSGYVRFEEHLHIGPKPQTRWLGAQIFIDKIFAGLRREVTPIDHLAERELYRFDMMLPIDEMTHDEMAAFAVLCRLNTCFSSLLDTEFALQVPLSQAVDDVNHCLDGLLRRFREARETVNNGSLHLGQAVIVPHGQYLHSAFTLLEMCKLISTFSEAADIKAKSRSSLPKEQATRLRELVENFYRFIRKDAMYIKNCLYKDTVIGELLHVILEKKGGEKDSVATAIASLVEKPWIEKSCGDLVESWQDAVDGVLKVKLGLY